MFKPEASQEASDDGDVRPWKALEEMICTLLRVGRGGPMQGLTDGSECQHKLESDLSNKMQTKRVAARDSPGMKGLGWSSPTKVVGRNAVPWAVAASPLGRM